MTSNQRKRSTWGAVPEQSKMKAMMHDAKDKPQDKDKTEARTCESSTNFVRGALLLQEKWVLIIVFSLLSGPAGFSSLMRKGTVNTTTLTQRLNLLEQVGIVVKTVHSVMPLRTSYALTEAGLALGPILESIEGWSEKYLSQLDGPAEGSRLEWSKEGAC